MLITCKHTILRKKSVVLQYISSRLSTLERYVRFFGFQGFFLFIIVWALKPKTVITVKIPDAAYPFFLRCGTSDEILYAHMIHYRNTPLPSFLKSPKIVIDGGANIGLYSIICTNKYPSATIYAIEPEDSNLRMLRRNIENYPKIIPIQAALWDKECELTITESGGGHYAFQTVERVVEGKVIGTIQGVTIDGLMSKYKLDYIDLLKLDVEGAENYLLTHASDWLNRVGVLAIETHGEFNAQFSQTLLHLSEYFDYHWRMADLIFWMKKEAIHLP